MPSTFFGLTIAASGMNAYQVALNTTANNIYNVVYEYCSDKYQYIFHTLLFLNFVN